MGKTARLTVLMPVYNAEKFLNAAIDSILNQTFPDFEFLIIDDGSFDRTAEIIGSYSDSRIRFVANKQNLGISATLNKGLEMAATELIARMDADDISYPARLQKQYEYFQANPDCALLSAWAREITEDGDPIWTNRWRSVNYYYNLTFHCWIYHSSVMYRRSAVIDVGKYQIPYCEDYDLWWNLSRKYKIGNLEEVLLDYRLADSSLCRFAKKEEYETTHSQLVRRNIQYYVRDSFYLSDNEVEFLQNHCEPLLGENDFEAIIGCFRKLDLINQSIIKTDNVNRDLKCIRAAARDKKQLLIQKLRHKLPKRKLLMLLMRLGCWREIAALSVNYIFKKKRFASRAAD